MSFNFNERVAYDGGNGYAKQQIDDIRYIYPSIISRILGGNLPASLDNSDPERIDNLIRNFLHHMDITVKSDSISNQGRYLVGSDATQSDNIQTYNVSSSEGKSSSDINLICLFAVLAYNALAKYYRQNHELPKQNLNVNVDFMSTALPIDEYNLPGVVDQYRQRFVSGQHEVIINNFSKKITVTLNFNKVGIWAEGIVGLFGLIGDPQDPNRYRNDGIFDPLIQSGEFHKLTQKPTFSGEDILKVGTILLIDIGDGTVDCSLTDGLSLLPNGNESILEGVGNVAEAAVNVVHQNYHMMSNINRQTFMKIVTTDNTQQGDTFRKFLYNQVPPLETRILEKVKSLYKLVNYQIKLIVVSGGGAVILKNHFQPLLKANVAALNPLYQAPILWVDAKFAQTLNLDGLEFRVAHMR